MNVMRKKMRKKTRVGCGRAGKVMMNAPMTAAMAPLAPEAGMREKGSPRICARHGDDAADEVEDGKAEGAHGVFDLATEGPQVDHVADDVHPAAVHEHGGQKRNPACP